MRKLLFALPIYIVCVFLYEKAIAQAPGVEEFRKAFEAKLQKLKPEGTTKRTVKFVSVVKGTANGGYYPFKVVAYIHDYGPGYPPNKYYGQTCVGKMNNWKFDMYRDDFGDWIVQGAFTVLSADRTCAENPSEGVESIPLSGVPGTEYSDKKTETAVPAQQSNQQESKLYIGEYASYGYGGTLLAGMGFKLSDDGNYTDLDGKRGGKYSYNIKNATINFSSGFLKGLTGKNVKITGFQFSDNMYAQPWR